MCGIAGIFQLNGIPAEEKRVRNMADAMSHRGPDATGFYSEGPIALGHLRLSIIDLSVAANQPFTDDSGRFRISFNGEIYNFKEVKARLSGYPFTTNGDTEVLLAAFIKWGPACLQHLRGMFAFAIWDSQKRELFVARDPLGVKPLYYYKDEDKIVFASEVRAILASGLVQRRLSKEALIEYFSYQSVSFPYSPIAGIRQIRAGSWMRISEKDEEQGKYWDLVKPAAGADHLADYPDVEHVRKKIRELMVQSIERRLVSDVPVGAFLSGGIDSSAVVGLMAEVSPARPNTFHVCFEEKDYDESEFADIIAKKFNTKHSEILLKPSVFLDELQNALDALDSPSGDGVNTYVVSKAVSRQGLRVVLTGAGGDELFAGYPFFDQFLQLQAKRSFWNVPAAVRRPLTGLLMLNRSAGRKAKMEQFLRLPSVDISRVYPIFRQILSPLLLKDLTNLAENRCVETSVAKELGSEADLLAAMPLLSQVSVAEYEGYTQHTLLKDTDQMSMAVSLEAREPYFDQDLIEYVLGVPDKWKRPVYPKSLLVESLKPLLPDEVVHRKKKGFLFPWELWLRKELRGFGEKHIAQISQRSFVHGGQIWEYWKRFQKGDPAVRWQELWLFIVLDYWMEKNEVVC
jgi:asparagine synthase (glutamine-hydrolysing)